jgi:threonine dehydrogenase-like Zn-dependent dehydrogenase
VHRPLAACRVEVLGGGAIGLASAIVARHFGCQEIRIAETNPLRRLALTEAEGFACYEPGGTGEPPHDAIDLVIDAVGAAATRAAASRMVRPGGVIVHLGLLPGLEGFDIRKITLQEITVTGSYCYTPDEFGQVVAALSAGRLGNLGWFEERPLAGGARAFRDIDDGASPAAKIVLRPTA